jgi:chromate reductase, NAD(P)H dehydrogenase (quinone)
MLLVSGSLRRGSYNRALLWGAARELPPTVQVAELDGIDRLPAYNADVDQRRTAPEVAAFRKRVAATDALLIATPEYNASIPGALKNAIDWASRPWPACALRGKPVVVIGASTGLFGAVWAQAELRKVLSTVGAHVLDVELVVGSVHEAFAPDGSLTDSELRCSLHDAAMLLVEQVRSQAPVR